jgi:hypothetical protein
MKNRITLIALKVTQDVSLSRPKFSKPALTTSCQSGDKNNWHFYQRMSPTAGKHGKENLSTSFETPMTIFKR